MAKFIFRLGGYFNLKQKLEDQKKLEYGQALTKLEAEKQKRKRMLEDRSNSIRSFREQIEKRISPFEIQTHNNYLEYLKEAVKKQEKVIQAEEINVENKRLELVEAMKERKMLEKLKERDYAEYMIAEKKSEEKITDEVVSYRYSNRVNGG